MSERQAKMKRKNMQSEPIQKAKKTKFEIISNIVIVLLVVAFVGVGGWVIATSVDIDFGANNDVAQEQTIPTVAEYIAQNGITFDELMTNVGLTDDAEITEETSMDTVMTKMTLGKYAEFVGTDLETLKTQMGIPAEYEADAVVADVIAQMEEQAAQAAQENADNTAESETAE